MHATSIIIITGIFVVRVGWHFVWQRVRPGR